ncbi:methionyl-tRNA formyltransferase [Leuconostocaceae bacterium ESL0958]|nr:methionyl-tRNA formyltransferase [Leuconostocaceae bacterium ESL0958]
MSNRIVFMGTPDFAVPLLKALAADPANELLAVVTQPDRPQGRKKQRQPSPVKQAALDLGLTVLQPEKIAGSAAMAQIVDWQPDLIITAAFGQFLPEKLLAAAKHGAINAHASLLPKYRGGAPVHYAIMNGDQETGVSLMYMVKKMDAGDVLDVEKVTIQPDDNVGTMFTKLGQAAVDLVIRNIPALMADQASAVPQETTAVTFAPNISRAQQQLDFEKENAQAIDWHIRGLYPTHPAYTYLQGERCKLLAVKPLAETTTAAPGVITVRDKKRLVVAAADHSQLQIDRLQPAGKAAMDIAAYLNGAGKALQVGDMLIQKENHG